MKPSRKPPRYLTIDRIEPKSRGFARHIIAGARDTTRVWFLHATKGWRTETLR